jgi:uncharacterized protein (TIGR00369 family)
MSFKIQNPEFRQAILEKIKGQHFMHHIGFEINTIEPGLIVGGMPIMPHLKQNTGFLHGGLVATLCDIVAGFSASSLLPPGHHVVTGELKVSYLNPGIGNWVEAKGYVLKQGRKIYFCEAEIWTHQAGGNVLVAKASTTMIVVSAEEIGVKNKSRNT